MPDELTPSAAAQELQRLCDAATPGPWHLDSRGVIIFAADNWAVGNTVTHHGKHEGKDIHDARFIAACRNLLPLLLADHQRLTRIVRTYAEHQPGCPGADKCCCGLAEAMRALDGSGGAGNA